MPILFEILIGLRSYLLSAIGWKIVDGKNGEQNECRGEDICLFSVVGSHPIQNLWRPVDYAVVSGDLMKVDLRHAEVSYFDTWFPHSVNVNDVHKYIVNLDIEMGNASFVYLL